jgi:hypothetical protein
MALSPSFVGKSHPEVEGKLAEAADRYKPLALDPSCYEHAFARDEGESSSPRGPALSTIAYRRAPHDVVFWIVTTLNALGLLGFVAILIGLVTGDVGIGFE